MLIAEGVNKVSSVCEQGVNSVNCTGCEQEFNRVLRGC